MNSDTTDIEAMSSYRFIDVDEDLVQSDDPGITLTVEFYPSIDDLVSLTARINKRHQLPSVAKVSLQAFLAINLIGLPATLWFYDKILLGIVVFAANFAFAALFLPAVSRMDHRRYFKTLYPDLEDELATIQINQKGLLYERGGNTTFYPWKSFQAVTEEKEAIYFFLRSTGFAIRKSGFAYDEQKNAFVEFAKNRIMSASRNDTAPIDKSPEKNFDY